MSVPIGVTFNNPLNVRPGGGNWQGILKIEQTMAGQFLHMVDAPMGWRLAAANVIAHFDKWGHNTIATLIGGSGTYGQPDYRPGWAPPQDRNDTAAYIARVVGATGFGANDVLNFHAYVHLKPVLVAMAEVEQGASPYTWWTDAQIDKGLELAGVKAPPKPLPLAKVAVGATTTAGAATAQYVAQNPSSIDLGTAQSVLFALLPYFKWAGVLLAVVVVIGLGVYLYKKIRERKLGIA